MNTGLWEATYVDQERSSKTHITGTREVVVRNRVNRKCEFLLIPPNDKAVHNIIA